MLGTGGGDGAPDQNSFHVNDGGQDSVLSAVPYQGFHGVLDERPLVHRVHGKAVLSNGGLKH